MTVRPAPDTMVYLTALLPVAQGVGVYAALKAAAATAIGTGAAQSSGQAMADELVRRVTGTSASTAGGLPLQPVSLRLTMSSDALLAQADDPAFLSDGGPIPAEAARALVADHLDGGVKLWLKRLFLHPESRQLVAMESSARLFPAALAEFIDLRDQFCRNLWCNARIRHIDHVDPHANGGPTSAVNGQGLCVACNLAKEGANWRSTVPSTERHTVVITAPTGHSYRSRAPALV